MWRWPTNCSSFLLLLAQQADVQAEPRRQLDPIQRLQLISALALVIALGALAILMIRVAGRLFRWYARDGRLERTAARSSPDVDDWASKPLAPPWDESQAERPSE